MPGLIGLLGSIVAALATAALLVGCDARAPAKAGSVLTPCRLDGIARELRCGDIDVAENPDHPDGRKIGIHFAVVPAAAARKLDDPVFVIAGGPGQSATRLAAQVLPLFEDLGARRDIVFVDQRGTGQSHPLACDDAKARESLAQSLDAERATARLRACRERLVQAGNDLAQYATWIAVRDFDQVRTALGAERINLWGVSYGTRAALEYARQFPTHVRSMVLDGVAPAALHLPVSFALDTDAALDAWIRACETDRDCKARSPDLRSRIAALFERAGAGITAEVTDPDTGVRQAVRLTRDNLLGLVQSALYVPAASAMLPYALEQASHEDYAALLTLGRMIGGAVLESFSEGMHFSVICAEDMAGIDASARASVAATRAGTAFIDQYTRVCADWPKRPVPAAFYSVPKLAAPVLLMSGGLDPATPPRHAQAIAPALGNALHLIAPTLGHGISAQACGPELVRKFIRNARFDGLQTNCYAALPLPILYAPTP